MTQAIAFTKTQVAELVTIPTDETPLKPHEIAGRTLVTLTSPGTELNAYVMPDRKDQSIGGYAAVFEVEAVGSEVTHVRPGQRAFCWGRHQSRQRTSKIVVLPVPDGLSSESAVFARLMGVSWTTLVTTAACPGDRVLVTGLGPVGNLAAQIFASAGFVVTAADPVEARRQVATGVGLTDVRAAAPLDDKTLVDVAALALECSGHEQATLDACKIVRKGGEVVLIGVPWRRRTEMFAHDILHAVFHRYAVLRSGWEWEMPRERRDFDAGSINGNTASALEWLRQGRVKTNGLYRVAPPADCQPVWQDLLNQRGPLTTVFDWSKL